MNILEIIRKAPKDHVYWNILNGECSVVVIDSRFRPIKVIKECCPAICLYKDGKFFKDSTGGECILFPSKDNRDWAAFERELDGKPEEKQPKFIPADDDSRRSIEVGDTFDGSIEMVSIPDRPMMAAVIMSGLLAGGFKDSAGVLANKAVHYADIILKHTEEENNDKGTN